MSEKQKGARRRVSAVGRSAGSLQLMLVGHQGQEEGMKEGSYMVKQSYMKLSAAGPTTVLTSSGIGGAWLREPSL